MSEAGPTDAWLTRTTTVGTASDGVARLAFDSAPESVVRAEACEVVRANRRRPEHAPERAGESDRI